MILVDTKLSSRIEWDFSVVELLLLLDIYKIKNILYTKLTTPTNPKTTNLKKKKKNVKKKPPLM